MAAQTGPARDQPLAGTWVVELGERVGCAVCGALLAQLGATVIVVEHTGTHALPAAAKARFREQLAHGKLSLGTDLSSCEDDHVLRELIARAEVVLHAGDIRSLPWLEAAAREDGVSCDITAFGHSGPMAGVPYTEWQMQGITGVVDTTGLPDGPPIPVPIPVVELLTGVYAAAAVVAALRVRRLHGVGQAIDMALFDCAFAAVSTFLQKIFDGSGAKVSRMGNRHSMAVPWNVYRASDGWVLICAGSDEQWARLCEVMGESALGRDERYLHLSDRIARVAEIDPRVQQWVATQTVASCVEQLTAASVASGPVAPVDGHPREANLDHRGMIARVHDEGSGRDLVVPSSAFRMSRTPGSTSRRLARPGADRERIAASLRATASVHAGARGTPRAPLAGIRVIEIGHYTTAPLAARILASLGAEVIKIEPPAGEAVRDWPPVRKGMGIFFAYANSDKRSLVLELNTASGRETLRRLLATSDVLLENLRPGTLAKRGFPPAEIERINPRLVYCPLSGFGVQSLYEGRPAFDTVIQAMSGIMDLIRAGDVPVKSGISTADLLGGQMAVVAVLAALEYRDRTGRGQSIDLSMQDVAAWCTQTAWGDAAPPDTCLLAATDGYVVAESTQVQALAALQGESASDGNAVPRFAMAREALAQRMNAAGIAAAPVLTVREMVALPQVSARRLWFDAPDEDGDPWPVLASPLRLAVTPAIVRHPMTKLGRDTQDILRELGESGIDASAR